jgi:hypothetical protein
MAVDSRVALAKLTSGQTLTEEEKQVLGLTPAPAPTTTKISDIPTVQSTYDAMIAQGMDKNAALASARYAGQAVQAGAIAPTTTYTATGTEVPGSGGSNPAKDPNEGKAGYHLDSTTGKWVADSTNKLNTTDKTAQQVDSIAAITALLSSYGIGDLAGPITNAVMKGYSTDTIELIMQDPNSTDPLAVAFQTRFPANKARAAANKAVLSPAEYLAAERTYAQVMKSYGVPTMATKENISSFLVNDVSPTEVSDRVGLAVDRVNNADQATKDALKQFYPMLTQGDLVQAVLNPAESLPTLKRKVQIAEIGGAAAAQKLSMGISDITTKSDLYSNITGGTMGAETLAGLGVTKEQAQAGYANIAEALPRAEFLSSISQGADYTQKQAEQEQFQGLASAKRARQQLSATEVGRFSGSSGTSRGSFSTGYLNKSASSGAF